MTESFRPPRQHHKRILVGQIMQPPGAEVVVWYHVRHRVDDMKRTESRRHVTRDEVYRGDVYELTEEHSQMRERHRRAQNVEETGGAICRVDQIQRDLDGRVRRDKPMPGVVIDLLVTVIDAVHVDDESLKGRCSNASRESTEKLRRYVIVVNTENLQNQNNFILSAYDVQLQYSNV